MGTVSEHVDESKAHVHTVVLLPAMVPKLVPHARLNVMSPAATHDAQRNASSPAPPVQKSPVFLCAHIANAPCPAPLHATTSLVLVGARNFSNADISVLLCVEKSVQPQRTAKFVQRMTSRIGTWIIFLVSRTRMLILM
ncbi:hypothetical protein N7451_002572 [Penicillium sp. IBT 35674x]|nr:hypothetical protein N7451_002572 [Penicillium sp. IBT 35674x]